MRFARPFTLLFTLCGALPVLEARAAAPVASVAPEAKTITKEQFAAMPDSAPITVRGTRTTAGALRAKQKANALAVENRIATTKKTLAVRGDAAVRRLQTEQTLRLEKTNTRLRAEAQPTAGLTLAPLAPVPPSYNGPPEIQSAPQTIEPGSYVPIDGRGFGALPGKVVMKGLPTGDRVLTLEKWTTTALRVSVPSDIVGVMDQTVRIQVIRKDGTSVERNVAFKATRDFFYMLNATLVKCGEQADIDTCDPRWGFFGVHTMNWWWELDSYGCDDWKVPPLKNGWTITEWDFVEMSNGGGRVGEFIAPSPGKTSWEWRSCWSVPGDGPFSGNGAGYMGSVTISGPKGLPYR